MSPEVKCDQCGTINPANAAKCRLCGMPLAIEGRAEACPKCGTVHALSENNTCVSCGWDFGKPKRPPEKVAASPESCEHWSEQPAHTSRIAMIDMAGILVLLAGALGITQSLLSALPGTGADLMRHYENIIPAGKFLNGVIQDNLIIAVLMFVAGALAMGLSMSVFKRGSLTFALAGAVFGIVAVGFLVGAFFALVGLLLLVVSRREFLLECS